MYNILYVNIMKKRKQLMGGNCWAYPGYASQQLTMRWGCVHPCANTLSPPRGDKSEGVKN